MLDKDSIFVGTIKHKRRFPALHEFTYPMYMFALSLENLEQARLNNMLFAYDRCRVLSIKKQEHLGPADAAIYTKAEFFLKQQGISVLAKNMFILTTPRFMGYVFNPVNFIFCFDSSRNLIVVIVQINNTYDESHVYILPVPTPGNGEHISASCNVKKEFFVSPFNNLDGMYQFKFNIDRNHIEIIINLICDDKIKIHTMLKGDLIPYTLKNIAKTCLANLLYPLTIRFKIFYQAIKLKRKGLKYLLRPWHKSDMTIKKNHHKHDKP